VEAEDVTGILDALDEAAVTHWIEGGWGVAALAGRQTRPHRDLDLAVDAADLDRCRRIAGRDVPCLSARQQRLFHTGYEHRAKDIHDLAQLDALPGQRGPAAD
jgi:hypothetical protein